MTRDEVTTAAIARGPMWHDRSRVAYAALCDPVAATDELDEAALDRLSARLDAVVTDDDRVAQAAWAAVRKLSKGGPELEPVAPILLASLIRGDLIERDASYTCDPCGTRWDEFINSDDEGTHSEWHRRC